MSDPARTGTPWLKYGCFGCLGVLALLLLVAAGIIGLAMLTGEPIQQEDQVLNREIGPLEPTTSLTSPDLPETTVPTRLALDISDGEALVSKGNQGDAVKVEGRFDTNYYELVEETEGDGETGLTYRIRFRRTSRYSFLTSIRELISGTKPSLKIFLPPNIPIELDLDNRQGGVEIDASGLWFVSMDVHNQMGGVVFNCSKPTLAPVESMKFRNSMGGLMLSGIGNASPKTFDASVQMGGLVGVFNGAWTRDSDISISCNMGGSALTIPRRFGIEGLGPEYDTPPGTEEIPAPVLRFTLSGDPESFEIGY